MGLIIIILAINLVLGFLFYRQTRQLKHSITQLRRFAKKLDRNEMIDEEQEKQGFPDGELGEISRYIVHIYQQNRQAQEDQARLKRQLTQNISHELKTPVASIQGYIETLIDNPTIDEQQRLQFLQRAHAQSIRLVKLINDISAIHRMDDEAGLQSLHKENVCIADMLNQIIQESSLELDEKGMTFANQLSADVIVRGDYSLLYSIFRNLTDNALTYAGKGADILVRCRTENAYYHFVFSDSGVGLSPEHLPHIFERFYRVDKGRSRKLGGTGLGLAIVKNAVVLHGGQIHATVGENGGLAFHFTLKRQ